MTGRSPGVTESPDEAIGEYRRVYREPRSTIIGLAIFAATFLVMAVLPFLVRRVGNPWIFLLVFGPFAAFFSLLALGAATSVTVVDATGVRPRGPDSPVIPWEEIDSFAAIKQKGSGYRACDVTLIPTGNQRPVKLRGTPSSDEGAHGNVDELNRVLSEIRARRQEGRT